MIEFLPASQFTQPARGEPPAVVGVDFDQAQFPDHPLLVAEPHILVSCMQFYLHEKVIPNARVPKRSIARVAYVARKVCEAWDFDRDVSTLKRADCRMYRQRRLAEGVADASIRRELSIAQAAVRHAAREERIKAAPQFEIPPGSEPRVRFLTQEEHKRLMSCLMSPRLRRFFVLAFGTGARSEAIEELTWDRVDMENRLIDFRVPGVRYKNKRRVIVPISDDLFRRLRSMKETATDNYVIGLSKRGRVTTTYHEARRVMDAIGIKEFGVARHVARHTFVSWRLQRGCDMAHVAALIGDTVQMASKVYGHLQPAHLIAAANMQRAA